MSAGSRRGSGICLGGIRRGPSCRDGRGRDAFRSRSWGHVRHISAQRCRPCRRASHNYVRILHSWLDQATGRRREVDGASYQRAFGTYSSCVDRKCSLCGPKRLLFTLLIFPSTPLACRAWTRQRRMQSDVRDVPNKQWRLGLGNKCGYLGLSH